MTTGPALLRPLLLIALLVLGAACTEIRDNEQPQATNPNWTPARQGGNRP